MVFRSENRDSIPGRSKFSLLTASSPLLVPILFQTNPVHVITSRFFKIHFNIVPIQGQNIQPVLSFRFTNHNFLGTQHYTLKLIFAIKHILFPTMSCTIRHHTLQTSLHNCDISRRTEMPTYNTSSNKALYKRYSSSTIFGTFKLQNMRWAVYIRVVCKKDVKMHIEISRTTEGEETTLTTQAKIKKEYQTIL